MVCKWDGAEIVWHDGAVVDLDLDLGRYISSRHMIAHSLVYVWLAGTKVSVYCSGLGRCWVGMELVRWLLGMVADCEFHFIHSFTLRLSDLIERGSGTMDVE